MKPSMHLNMSPHLAMTPQLQQAIRLLQLSTIDLKQEIQDQVESNPMLDINLLNEEESTLQSPTNEEDFTDVQWSTLYTPSHHPLTFNQDSYAYENLNAMPFHLQDYLRWQLDLTPMTDMDKMIGTTIIDSIDDDGFLTSSMDDLLESLKSDADTLDSAEIEAVRHRIQQFDPLGCGSVNLAETLSVQLQQLPASTPLLALAKTIVKSNLDLLGKHQYHQLMKIYHIDEQGLEQVLRMIHSLKPKPGSDYHAPQPSQIIPDLIVKKLNGFWHVELNPYSLPHLGINHYYASLLKHTTDSFDYQFLKNNLQEARWFLKSIKSRQETLLKVSRYIVNYQRDFLTFGSEAMKPLILNDVAHALDMHESTISRVTTQKYIHTPRGLFELRYFFSSHIATNIGGECSSTAIKALIKKLIRAEDCKKPLSDQKIALFMQEQGINIARRTVAKYRELMGLLPSHERKSISC